MLAHLPLAHGTLPSGPREILRRLMRDYVIPPSPRPLEVAFTGFDVATERELIAKAKAAGFFVRKSVTLTLSFLVAGPNAGPSKLATAKGLNCPVISVEEFHAKIPA